MIAPLAVRHKRVRGRGALGAGHAMLVSGHIVGAKVMRAITVEPGRRDSARIEELPEPDVQQGAVLVEAVAVGVCGTDVEIVEGQYGWPPPRESRLVLGHESLGRVIDPGTAGSLKK